MSQPSLVKINIRPHLTTASHPFASQDCSLPSGGWQPDSSTLKRGSAVECPISLSRLCRLLGQWVRLRTVHPSARRMCSFRRVLTVPPDAISRLLLGHDQMLSYLLPPFRREWSSLATLPPRNTEPVLRHDWPTVDNVPSTPSTQHTPHGRSGVSGSLLIINISRLHQAPTLCHPKM